MQAQFYDNWKTTDVAYENEVELYDNFIKCICCGYIFDAQDYDCRCPECNSNNNLDFLIN